MGFSTKYFKSISFVIRYFYLSVPALSGRKVIQ